MATIGKTERVYEKAKRKLEKWEKKWGERLDELKRKLWRGEYGNKEKKMRTEEKEYLEREKNELAESKKSWEVLYQEELRGRNGNEQNAIYKKLFSIHSISFIHLFIYFLLYQ